MKGPQKRNKGERWRIFKSSLMAGIFIGMASLGYVRTGGTWLGILLFACGLIGCIWYSLYLYTGWIGYARWRDYDFTHWILLGNICGTGLVAWIALSCLPGLPDQAAIITQARLDKTWWEAFCLGIPCGLLMSFAVAPFKPGVPPERKTWLPLLFAVPMFIICGFLHSIADSAYFWFMGLRWIWENLGDVVAVWFSVVFGNLIGCNIYRFLSLNNVQSSA